MARKKKPAAGGRYRKSDPSVVYQLRIALRDVEPPVWRVVLAPDMLLGDLHVLVQVVMGWENDHLHQFTVKDAAYGPPLDDPFGPSVKDEDRALLSGVLGPRGKLIRYEYDFGDGWNHDIRVEKRLAPVAGERYPRCLDGARACPPEDCGGPWGYAHLLDALARPGSEEHEDMIDWLGDDFDPEAFGVDEVNATLDRVFR